MDDKTLWYSLLISVICGAITIFIRLIPIIFFRKKNLPKWIQYLGDVLPFAIMPILVMYCIRGTQWTTLSSVVPTLCGIVATTLIHLWKKNTVISLICGLGMYMVLIHVM